MGKTNCHNSWSCQSLISQNKNNKILDLDLNKGVVKMHQYFVVFIKFSNFCCCYLSFVFFMGLKIMFGRPELFLLGFSYQLIFLMVDKTYFFFPLRKIDKTCQFKNNGIYNFIIIVIFLKYKHPRLQLTCKVAMTLVSYYLRTFFFFFFSKSVITHLPLYIKRIQKVSYHFKNC